MVRDATNAPVGAVVRVIDARARPNRFHLRSGTCVIGAGAGVDVVIDDGTVSRRHVELTLVPEGVHVTDLGSRNGTLVLGHRVERATVTLGSRIMLGSVEVALEADAESLGTAVHPEDEYRGIVGRSIVMRRIFATLARLEGSLIPALVQGESGVGKELIARGLHDGSSLANGPFVAVNCGAMPRELVTSELFGHRRGAFTGAVENRQGAFQAAHGGTLFLDEVGELPLEVQPVLLRALETGDVRPVGGDMQHVAVRVVAATNRDLLRESRDGRFREDLYYRLAVVRIDVPPLRERRDDIAAIAARIASSIGAPELPRTIVEQLQNKAWPGNVRELRNAILSYVALGTLPMDRAIESSSLDSALSDFVDISRPYADQKEELAERFTRAYLQALMSFTGGNQSAAARAAGLDRSYLGKLLVKHGLSK